MDGTSDYAQRWENSLEGPRGFESALGLLRVGREGKMERFEGRERGTGRGTGEGAKWRAILVIIHGLFYFFGLF